MKFPVPAALAELQRKIFAYVLILTGLSLISGCAQTGSKTSAQITPSPSVVVNTTDLKKLRWIEGTWRGTGGGIAPFVERYKFENDTTLAVESFAGEKLDKVTDLTRFQLKDGEFGGGSEGSRYVASSIDDKSVTFQTGSESAKLFPLEV